jgi:hypothetical protein
MLFKQLRSLLKEQKQLHDMILSSLLKSLYHPALSYACELIKNKQIDYERIAFSFERSLARLTGGIDLKTDYFSVAFDMLDYWHNNKKQELAEKYTLHLLRFANIEQIECPVATDFAKYIIDCYLQFKKQLTDISNVQKFNLKVIDTILERVNDV